MLAATTAGSVRRVMMAGMNRACAVGVVLLCHFIFPGHLNNIP
jgi:hypothetical protein